MGRKVLAVTFCNVKVNGYIYGVSENCGALLTYKWKVLEKEINVERQSGKFGGKKITRVILTCKLVEYCGKEYHQTITQKLGFNGNARSDYLGNRITFPNKELFIDWLKHLEDTYKRNLENIQSIIKNQIQR